MEEEEPEEGVGGMCCLTGNKICCLFTLLDVTLSDINFGVLCRRTG